MIEITKNALAPVGWTIFNEGVPRRADLDTINARVNNLIIPRDADAEKPWRFITIPTDGCCHDFAVTKRAWLMALGWPASQLLLAEVAYDKREDHMVLVVDVDGGLVLDNLRPDIVPWDQAGYRLVRIQRPDSPNHWGSP